MHYHKTTPAELLGSLNQVEEKYAPSQLFVAGDTDYLSSGPRVSIVGSRKASPEGLSRASKLAAKLTKRGAVVVSGLAEGIDTAAHTRAIEEGGRTIAVIGTPLDKCYPRKNARLQEQIANEHLLISQFPSGYPTKPGCFPMRNRTMALLSDATVIAEASESSGSLSQAVEALRLGRGLFIMQSLVENSRLKWPTKLLDSGARILSDATFEKFFEFLPHRLEHQLDGAIPF